MPFQPSEEQKPKPIKTITISWHKNNPQVPPEVALSDSIQELDFNDPETQAGLGKTLQLFNALNRRIAEKQTNNAEKKERKSSCSSPKS